MADYKNIKGFNIQYLDSDPPNPIEGQMWFNSTTQTLKGAEVGGVTAGTWASGGNLNTGRVGAGGAGGSNSDGLCFGGTPAAPRAITESYNGTSWTEVADLNLGRNSGAGIGVSSTAALYVSGLIPPITTPPTATKTETEQWNGTSWTEIADVNLGRWRLRGCGVTTAAIVMGGGNPWPLGGSEIANTELYNGTSWTEVNDLNQVKRQVFAFGTSTAALSAGGYNGTVGQTSNTELWDGTSWTEVNNLNTARSAGAASGVQTLGIINAGEPAPITATEYWDGTSWTEVNDSVVGYSNVANSQLSSTSALKFSGEPGTQQATEEWTVPEYVVKTFTTS